MPGGSYTRIRQQVEREFGAASSRATRSSVDLEFFVQCWNTGASTKSLMRHLGLSYAQTRLMWVKALAAGLPLLKRDSHHKAPPGWREKLDQIMVDALK